MITTTSNYIVTPFVGSVPYPYRFVKNPNEVEKIVEVPIQALLDDHCLTPAAEYNEGKKVDSWEYHYQGNIIWGATARILNNFLEIYRAAAAEKT